MFQIHHFTGSFLVEINDIYSYCELICNLFSTKTYPINLNQLYKLSYIMEICRYYMNSGIE